MRFLSCTVLAVFSRKKETKDLISRASFEKTQDQCTLFLQTIISDLISDGDFGKLKFELGFSSLFSPNTLRERSKNCWLLCIIVSGGVIIFLNNGRS